MNLIPVLRDFLAFLDACLAWGLTSRVALVTVHVVLLYLFIDLFWGLYALIMNLYRVKLAGKLNGVILFFGGPYAAAGVLVDVFAQYTLANIFFWGLPRAGEHLVTTRLIRLRKEMPDNWRGRFAAWICERGLDALDPTGDHC